MNDPKFFEKIQKIFDNWNFIKKDISVNKKRIEFKERDVFFMHVGKNVGYEQDGKGEDFLRPVVIFRKFNKDVFWGIPLTTKKKYGKFYFHFKLSNEVDNYAILSQLKLYDIRRYNNKLGAIKKEDFKKMISKVKDLFPKI